MVSRRREARTVGVRVLGAAVLIVIAGCICEPWEDLSDEAVLRTNLKTLRDVIREYEGPDRCVRELDELVAEGHLRGFP